VDGVDDGLQAVLADVRAAGVQVGDERHPQAVQSGRPVVELERVLGQFEAARLGPQRAVGERCRGDGGEREARPLPHSSRPIRSAASSRSASGTASDSRAQPAPDAPNPSPGATATRASSISRRAVRPSGSRHQA
jgi:hypothetical protein